MSSYKPSSVFDGNGMIIKSSNIDNNFSEVIMFTDIMLCLNHAVRNVRFWLKKRVS